MTTAPFVVYRLIQRLVTSNPSPRYVTECVNAFRTGTYDGVTYSGEYGDLQATVTAILSDRRPDRLFLMQITFGRLESLGTFFLRFMLLILLQTTNKHTHTVGLKSCTS